MTNGEIWTAIIGLIEALCIFFLSYVVYKLDKVVDRFSSYVTNSICDAKMCEQHDRITELRKDVSKHSEEIGYLKGMVKK